MLILTRTPNKSIVIGDDIVITILGVQGKQVSIGIEAPKGISVHREEIFLKINKETAK